MLSLYVSVGYSIVNVCIAVLVFVKSRRNLLGQFYFFCVLCLVALGAMGYMLQHPTQNLPVRTIEQATAFMFAVFPFFFLHFMLLFVRRHEILKSKAVMIVNYFAGLFSYVVVLKGFIPNPFSPASAMPVVAYTFYITWMSIFFSIGVALLYSLIGGFSEKRTRPNLLFVSFAFVMLALPTPFTLAVFSRISDNTANLYFLWSTAALAGVVYIVFRHWATMNTPYQAVKAALGAMNDMLIKTDANLKIEMVHGPVLPLLGYQESELLGHPIRELIQAEALLQKYCTSEAHSGTKEAFFEADVPCKNGSCLPMEFSFTPVWTNEEITGLVGVGRNIAERRRAEKGLQESEARYRSLFEHNPSPMWVYDRETLAILVVNDAAVQHYGYSEREFLKMTMIDILAPECAPMFPKEIAGGSQVLLRSGGWRHRKLDGTLIDVEMTSHALDFGNRPARLVLINDVTERKRSEEALRASEERYRLFFQEDLTGDVTTRPDGQILECNPAFARIFGYSSVEHAMQRSVTSLYPSPGAYRAFLRQLRNQKKLEYHETELRRADGASVFVIENVIGKFGHNGELLEIKSYIFDNTGRKKLESQLQKAQQMENLGTLAGGIAHDFNNTLAIILAHAALLKHVKLSPEKFGTSVAMIQKAVERAAGMVRQLMTFARKTETLFESVKIDAAINEIAKMLSSTLPKTITISTSLEEKLPTIIADRNQLYQVLLNLCVNARDAIMPDGETELEGGTITIGARTVRDTRVRQRFPDAGADRYIEISVKDTGIGMNEATMQHIFEPFFTTKGPGKGTGLGLAVVYGVVKGHRGFIDVTSQVGLGTEFTLYFPVPTIDLDSDTSDDECQEQEYKGEVTILLVEDEEMLLDSLKIMLEERGYRVLTAKDGEEAVNIYIQHQDEIAFVLSDLGLPKMGGWEAFLRMKRVNPKIKVVFGSGHVDPAYREKLLEAGAIDFIQKPYLPQEILRRINEAMCG